MKSLGIYGTYEHANDAQITLLAAEIDAKVDYVQGSSDEGKLGGYGLFVDEDRFEEAKRLLTKEPVDGFRPSLRCPACEGENLEERKPPWYGVYLLGIPIVAYVIDLRLRGRKFRCRECGNEFRKKP